MMVKRVLVAVAAIASLGAIAACGGGSDDQGSGGSATASEGKITVIMPSLANDAYLLEKAGADAEAKRFPGQMVSVVTGSGQSSSELVSKIEDAITRETDVIAINAGDPQAGGAGAEARDRAGDQGRRLRRAHPRAHG